jgi:putative ABC transport system permease protein
MTSMPFEGLGKGRRLRLEAADMAAVRAEAVELAAISGEWQQTLNLDYGTKTLPVDASGVEPVFGDMRNIIPEAGGRWLNAIDEARQRRVLFIGDKLATDLLGNDTPVGRTVPCMPLSHRGRAKKKQDLSYSNRDEDAPRRPRPPPAHDRQLRRLACPRPRRGGQGSGDSVLARHTASIPRTRKPWASGTPPRARSS